MDDADDAGITGTMNGVTFSYYAVPSYRTLIIDYGLVFADVLEIAIPGAIQISERSPTFPGPPHDAGMLTRRDGRSSTK